MTQQTETYVDLSIELIRKLNSYYFNNNDNKDNTYLLLFFKNNNYNLLKLEKQRHIKRISRILSEEYNINHTGVNIIMHMLSSQDIEITQLLKCLND